MTNIFHDILSNRAIIIPTVVWLIAQSLKILIILIKAKKFDIKRIYGSGGMPSSHSAYVISIAIVIGKNHGFDSSIFALALAIAIIVMYDAAGVRRAAGNQAKVLNELISTNLINTTFDEKLKELLGHTPFEVIIGAILGLSLGLILG